MKRIHLEALALGLALTAVALYLTFTSDHEENAVFAGATSLVAVWAFIGSGLVAWIRRPENGFGVLMTAVGFAWFVGALSESNASLPYTIGTVFGGLFAAVFVHALLAFPRGYLETRIVSLAVGTSYALVMVGPLLAAMFDDFSQDCAECPPNAFLVSESDTAVTVITGLMFAIALPVLGSIAWVLIRRWRAAAPPLRRLLLPVYLTASVSIALLAVAIAVATVSEGAADLIWWLVLFAFASVPVSFLAGILRTRLARASVGQLVVDLGTAREPKEVRVALRRALGDPTLLLGYWLPDAKAYVDVFGQPFDVEAESSPDGRVATTVEHDGELVAALVHDLSLRDQPELVRDVTAAASLALDRERSMQALRQSEGRYRALLDALPDLMFRLSPDGRYIALKGDPKDLVVAPEAIVGRTVEELLPPDVARVLLDSIDEALATGEVVTAEYELEVGGVLRQWEARTVKDGDGAVLIVRDFSERKQAQAELERLHEELQARHRDLERERDFIRTVVDTAPSVFCLVTPEGEIVRFNHTLEKISGRTDNVLVRGLPFWEVFVAQEERDAVRWEFAELSRRGFTAEYENTWVSRSGEPRLIAWSLTPIQDEFGAPRYLISGMDVTERKRQERELRRSRTRLLEAGDIERRRLERNLHDGAQQRLVSLSLALRLAQAQLHRNPEEAERLLASASEELALALAELRELARGIHPAVLSDRGLSAALESLISRSPLPVRLALPADRLPEPIEAAAYYVVSEALANVAKYAEASTVAVSVARLNGNAVVEVKDDGKGGADPTVGSGLRGLADRVEALDGRLVVDSTPGGGTRIRAEIPCG